MLKWLETVGTTYKVRSGVFYYFNPLKKGIHYFHYCEKCGLRVISIKDKWCHICFLKTKRLYSSAIKTIKETDWWNCKTGINDCKVGWSFAEETLTMLLFGAVVNCCSLNKTPKFPELMDKTEIESLRILGVSEWRIKTTLAYYGED